MKKTCIVLILIISTVSMAAGINQSHIPANAKWIMHIDFDMLRSSQIGKLFRWQIEQNQKQKIEGLNAFFGMDIIQDIHGVTLYGPNAEEQDAAILVYAKYDKDRLLSLLKLGEQYRESTYAGHTIYYWSDRTKHRDQVGAFVAGDLIVLSQSEGPVVTVLDLLNSDTPQSLARTEDNVLKGLSESPEGSIMVTAAIELNKLTAGNDSAVILQNSKMAAITMVEKNGDLTVNIDLIAESVEAATQIQQVILGMKAFLTLGNNQASEMSPLIQAISLQQNENQLSLFFKYPSDKLFEIMKNAQDLVMNFHADVQGISVQE